MGTVEVVSGWRLAGQVRLSNTNGIPAHTQLFVDREAGYMDGLSLELPPDGRFDLAHLPGETLVLNFGLPGYRPSGLNASIDPRSPSQLIGRLQSDYTNLTILLEPGQYRWDEFASRPQGEPPDKLPLGGTENPRNRLVLSGRVLDADTGAPLPQCRITLGRKPNPRYPAVLWDRTPRLCTNGAFAFELTRLIGAVRLKLEAEGYQPMLSEPLPASSSNYVFELKSKVDKAPVPLRGNDASSGRSAMLIVVAMPSATKLRQERHRCSLQRATSSPRQDFCSFYPCDPCDPWLIGGWPLRCSLPLCSLVAPPYTVTARLQAVR